MTAGFPTFPTMKESSLFGRLRSSNFQVFAEKDITRGSSFLSGIGPWPSLYGIRRTRRFNLVRVLIAHSATDTEILTSSSHPSSREGHLSAGRRNPAFLRFVE